MVIYNEEATVDVQQLLDKLLALKAFKPGTVRNLKAFGGGNMSGEAECKVCNINFDIEQPIDSIR